MTICRGQCVAWQIGNCLVLVLSGVYVSPFLRVWLLVILLHVLESRELVCECGFAVWGRFPNCLIMTSTAQGSARANRNCLVLVLSGIYLSPVLHARLLVMLLHVLGSREFVCESGFALGGRHNDRRMYSKINFPSI